MTTWTVLVVALREIRRNAMRSALTMLGIVIGVAAVIALVTLGRGAASTVTGSISALGRNLLVAAPGGHGRMGPTTGAPPFELADAEAIAREAPGVAAVAPVAVRPMLAIYGNENWTTTVIGTDDAYLSIREWPLSAGRAFSTEELLGGRMVCILGATVREHLFGTQDPLDADIRLGSLACRVVGVLQAKGQGPMGADQDDCVLLPIRAFHRRVAGNREVGFIYISAQTSAETPRVQRVVTQLLRERRPVAYGEQEDFHVHDMKEITSLVEDVTGILTALLSAIAAISLLVGGIGIMNVMLVSVTERTREIGVRLAIGAMGREVMRQFLAEALALSLAGGVIGIALGLASSALAARLLHVGFAVNGPAVAGAFLFSGIVGVAFGFFPARKAARLDPIEALRYE
ncbi:MAG TPA: ABC transporter permease [Longimicrobiaceae bacterium]|nr:ABC transporter permease [Longimicrobiaceae bacterium]